MLWMRRCGAPRSCISRYAGVGVKVAYFTSDPACAGSSTQTVDRFNNLFVTAFVSPGSAKFLLLHDGKNDDSIRNFFLEIYDLYLRVRYSVTWLLVAASGWIIRVAV